VIIPSKSTILPIDPDCPEQVRRRMYYFTLIVEVQLNLETVTGNTFSKRSLTVENGKPLRLNPYLYRYANNTKWPVYTLVSYPLII
jgi:hypothetical protein